MSVARPRSTTSLRPLVRADGLLWLLPIVVIGGVYFSPRHVASPGTAVTVLLGLLIVLSAARRPDLSLLGLIVFLPFQGLVLAKLWSWGLPASVAGHLGAWKEALALGVVLAGARSFIAAGRRADALDRIALAFIVFAVLYALLQPEIVSGSPSTSSVRLLGFREAAGFVLVLLGARHAPLGPRFAERACRAVFVVGAIVAAIGVYEAVFSSAWNHFIVHTIKYPAYQIAVLHGHPGNTQDIRVYGYIGNVRFVRIGSVFLNELNCAFYLVLPLAVGIERVVRRMASPPIVLGTLVIGAALLLTQTRSAILAGVIVAALALAPAAGRSRHWRTQVAIALMGLAVVAVPFAASTGVVKRFQQVNNRSDQSTSGHVAGFWSGLDTIGAHPLGQGLGTAAGIGQRFSVRNDTIPENTYLDVGDELGILPMLIFAALTIVVVLKLRGVARARSDPLVTATWAAGVGLAVAAWFLQTWLDFGVAWTYWGVAGAMVGLAPHGATVKGEQPEGIFEPQPAVAG